MCHHLHLFYIHTINNYTLFTTDHDAFSFHLKTSIGNLLENAIEELSNGEHEIKEITLGLYCDPDCNIITCEDTGGGIRPDLIDRIYERGVSSKGENRGTGLFLIKQLVEESHGDISIETEEGEGTCFTITFTGKEKPSCTM